MKPWEETILTFRVCCVESETIRLSRSVFQKSIFWFYFLCAADCRLVPVLLICSCPADCLLVPEILTCSRVTDYCWVPVFLTSSCAVLQRLLLQFKIDLSNFPILVDRVANWGKLTKSDFSLFYGHRGIFIVKGHQRSSSNFRFLRFNGDFIKDHRGKLRGKFSWNFLHQVIVIVREWTIGLFRS